MELSPNLSLSAVSRAIGGGVPAAALGLNFTGTDVLDSRITFTRADATSCATYFGSDGLLKTAAANVPRFDYDPATPAGVVGGELVANGSMFTDTIGWYGSNATLSVVDGKMVVSFAGTYKNFGVFPASTPGKTYKVTVRASIDGASGLIPVYAAPIIGGNTIINGATFASGASHTFYVVATGANIWIGFGNGNFASATVTLDSLSVQEVTFAPRGLLIEESRTNYCLQSEDFTQAVWTKTSITPSSNSAVAPTGTQVADTLTAGAANGTCTQAIATTAVAWTFSVYLKRLTGTGNVDITMDGTTWVTRTINSTSWTRCVVTQTGVAGTSNCGIRLVNSGDAVYAWGGQAE